MFNYFGPEMFFLKVIKFINVIHFLIIRKKQWCSLFLKYIPNPKEGPQWIVKEKKAVR